MGILSGIKNNVVTPRLAFEELEERVVLDASLEMMAYDPIFADVDTQEAPSSIEDWDLLASSQADTGPQDSNDAQSSQSSMDVVLISDEINDLDNLVAAVSDNSEIVIYNSDKDNLESINSALNELAQSNDSKIGRLGLMAHGEPGELKLGADSINLENIAQYKQAFKSLSANLTDDAQIQIYGCSVASNSDGRDLVNHIAAYTTADVFASVDNTGGESKDWDLEFTTNKNAVMASMLKPDLIASVNTELVVTVTVEGNPNYIYDDVTFPATPNQGNLFNITANNGDPTVTLDWSAADSNIKNVNLDTTGLTSNTKVGSTWEITGTQAAVNNALDTLNILATDNHDWDGGLEPAKIEIEVVDNDAVPVTDNASNIPVHRNGLPDFEENTGGTGVFPLDLPLPAGTEIAEGATYDILPDADINLLDNTDPDGGGPLNNEWQVPGYEATLTAVSTNGDLTVDPGGGAPVGDVNIVGDTLTYQGSKANIDLVLEGLQFTSDNTGNNGVITLSVNDNASMGTGGPKTTGDHVINIAVGPENDAPEITAPAALSSPGNQPAAFSAFSGNPIIISDSDAGDGQIQVTLAATNGNMTLSQTDGLTFLAGDGECDETMTFQGTVQAINAALDESFFSTSPTTQDFFTGASTLDITVDDLGNTGAPPIPPVGPTNHVINITFNDPGMWGRWPRV